MNRDPDERPDLDRLLRQAFADDLPADAEARLARVFQPARRRRTGMETAATGTWPRALQPRAVLAAAALAVVAVSLAVAGLLVGRTPPRRELGDGLAALQWAPWFAERTRAFQPLECTVRVDRPGQASRQVVIEWLSPGETRVRILAEGAERSQKFGSPAAAGSVLDTLAGAGPPEAGRVPPTALPPDLYPVEDLLSAARLRRLLDKQWQAVGPAGGGTGDRRIFRVGGARGEPPLWVTIDVESMRPVRLERETAAGARIEAHFNWRRGADATPLS
jgi:hypothetical protein